MEMYAVERRRWLVDHAREAGRIDVAEVAAHLDVARETVRRDLNVLESEGLVRRVHGGAVPVERLGFEGRLQQRNGSHSLEKARIAEHATHLIGGAESIYLDEGSTTQAFAERLHPVNPLTVVTNALPIAVLLGGRPNIDLVLVGGRVRGHTMATIDHWAVRMLDDFVFDLAVLGTNGVSLERGLTCPHSAVAAVKSRAVTASRRRMLLADGTKFGVDSSYRFAQMRDVTTVVTDRSAGRHHLRRIRALGVEAVVV